MISLKPYHELPCAYIDDVSGELYQFLEQETDALGGQTTGWIFLDTVAMTARSPAIVRFFNEHKLYVRHAAITLLFDDFKKHIDTKPVIAKVNIPISNTQGWVNQWYEISDDDLAKCPVVIDKFGQEVPNIDVLPPESFTLVAEVADMKNPMVFNSAIPHGVVKKDPTAIPRIIGSFTFFNEPLSFLRN